MIIRLNQVTETNSFPLNSQDPVTQTLLIVTMFGLTSHTKVRKTDQEDYKDWGHKF